MPGINEDSSIKRPFRIRPLAAHAGAIVISLAASLASGQVPAGQGPVPISSETLPDSPAPQIQYSSVASVSLAPMSKGCSPSKRPNDPGVVNGPGSDPSLVAPPVASGPCKMTWGDRYERFVDGPRAHPLTPGDKAWLAARDFLDPFNAVTILLVSAYSVGVDSHSPYGPGMPGFARNVGVSFCQDLTGEFFNTFLIPSIAHQDPRYHRMPKAKVFRRVEHSILQVVWTQGDNGKGMLNYGNLVGFAIDDGISNLYVPGRQTSFPASAARYATGIASAPIDNFITEFLPDVASHFHVQVVLIQRVINQVARQESPGSP